MRAAVARDGSTGGIGLALSGGAARGIAHVGVLETLAEAGIPVQGVAGTSAGAVVGSLFAAGLPLPAIRRLALETQWHSLLRVAVPHGGLVSGEGLERFLERVLPARRFSDLALPFVAVATDLETGARVDLRSGDLPRAVRASCSLPILFDPVSIAGRLLVDGGVSSQIPVRAVRETLAVSHVVAVDVNANGMSPGTRDTVAKVVVHLAMLWASRTAREEAPLADVLVSVDARGIPLHDLEKGPELLRRGREAARARLPEIRALLARRVRPLPPSSAGQKRIRNRSSWRPSAAGAAGSAPGAGRGRASGRPHRTRSSRTSSRAVGRACSPKGISQEPER